MFGRANRHIQVDQEQLKARVAAQAIDYARERLTRDAVLGVGTGTTVNHFIDALGRLRGQFDCCVASSEASAKRLKAEGFRVVSLNESSGVALYVDGADEADNARRLIKGGGGALTREKIVATASEHFLCIIDESKRKECLGAFPLAIEILPMAAVQVALTLARLGGSPTLRGTFVTDEGNPIMDVTDLDFSDPLALESEINQMPGVVANGIFARRPANQVMLASSAGISVY